MSYDPTPSQALLVFGLLGRQGESAQKDFTPRVEKTDREALANARFISVSKGRGFYLSLTDAGWAWAASHLSAELPPKYRILHELLARVGEHLKKSGVTLADFIGSKRKTGIEPLLEVAPRKKPPATARQKIEQAYLEITAKRNERDVSIADLRARLKNIDRQTFDAALAEMHLEAGKIHLMRKESKRAITEADREAAFQFKGNIFHILWIES